MREPLIYGAATHTGLVRANNEDHYVIMDHEGGFPYALILADGMGGHNRGELASQIAVEYVAERLSGEFDRNPQPGDYAQVMADILEKANVKVYLGSLQNENSRGMGTTLTLAVILPDQLLLAHIGDCRAYLLHGGEMTRLTVDHTLVQELVDAGSLTPEESTRHPRRHVLTRALGIPEYLQPDLLAVPIQPGDRLLLCSDGLHGFVSEDVIKALLKKDKTPDTLAEDLIRAALEAGGEDNVTVLAAFA